jgi:arabinogalactan oligomer/maltooligosaccharide transport system permease protein
MRFIKGDWTTKVSYLIMGFGNVMNGQIVKGLLFFILQGGFIAFFTQFAIGQLMLFDNLGDVATRMQTNQYGRQSEVFVDDSRKILLFSVISILLTIVFLAFYFVSTKSAYIAAQARKAGKHNKTFKEEVKEYLDSKFHTTLLTLPVLTIGLFTALPILFMILIAFTNYDRWHLPPGNLFTWAGFSNFENIFNLTSGSASVGGTFMYLTQWTLVWAVIATFSNYLLGMIFALMINKKGIKLKSLWRTLFVITIAVPQFISLLMMNQMLQEVNGAVNTLLHYMGQEIPTKFLNGTPFTARLTVIIINCWVGIPYTILITSGILMNIPEDLYESATIDGAGPVKSFTSITLPYMLFVTTPHLISNFVGNINNFNVIYLLTGGGPSDLGLAKGAGHTDLLVTWLFKITVEGSEKDYKLGSTIGILVFIFCATLSLVTFNMTKSARNEEEFS